jgi:hypothetical protein
MLKLTYTETDFSIERLTESLELWVSARVILALRLGNSCTVGPSTASFLLPAHMPGLRSLKAEVERMGFLEWEACDAEHVEISLCGTWLSTDLEATEGVFVTTVSDAVERLLLEMWQEAQAETLALREY